MDVYPRSTTWPYLIVVLLLFLLTLWCPHWWVSSGTGQLDWLSSGYDEASAAEAGVAALAAGPDAAAWIEPHTVPLQPPVAKRIAVSPEPAFAETAETQATARFPADSVVDQGGTESTLEVIKPASPVGPILPPGPPRPLDLTPADIDGLANSLPAEVMDHNPQLQSAADASSPMTTTWPRAVALWQIIGQLRTESAQVASWVNDVQDTLNTAQTIPTLEDTRALDVCQRMRELADRAPDLEVYLTEANRRQLRRIRYGLDRRAQVWQSLHQLAREQRATPQLVNVIDAVPVLADVDQRLSENPYVESWRAYLMLDKLTRIATETWVADPGVRCATAREVLRRISANSLTPEQQYVLDDPAVVHLKRKLEDWASAPIDLQKLVTSLEQFEHIRSATVAAQVIQQMQSLEFCRYPSADTLYRTLDMHYRNANVRFSVSSQLLNDLLPVLQPEDRRIRDRILGADVSGKNRTWTDLHLRLIEDASRLRLQIQVDGQSRSQTVSTKGPVRFFSRDRSQFQANKELIVSSDGIYARRATARAQGKSTLLDVQTDYDQIPLLGWLIRQMALDEHNEQQGVVRAEVRQRVEQHAERQLDNSIHERLTGLEDRLDEGILAPLRELKLDPKTLEMRTTPDRLVMRYRLAADSQLGAYTPRPRGVADNVMSMQLHESLANNLLAQLPIDDRRIELEELMKQLSQTLKIDRQDIHEEIPPDVVLHLGDDRPIQFEFDDERVLVTIRIQELTTPRRTWRNFVVRGRYRADVGQTHVDLQRDGGIELISEQLGFRDQVALRGIFTKVMTRDHRLNILRGRFLSDPRLNQLGVTQFVARDGWIGVSIGPLSDERMAAKK